MNVAWLLGTAEVYDLCARAQFVLDAIPEGGDKSRAKKALMELATELKRRTGMTPGQFAARGYPFSRSRVKIEEHVIG